MKMINRMFCVMSFCSLVNIVCLPMGKKVKPHKKEEDIGAILAEIQKKEKTRQEQKKQHKEQILRQFPLAGLFDPLVTQKEKYQKQLQVSAELLALFLQYLDNIEKTFDYLAQYDALSEKATGGTGVSIIRHVPDDADILAINQRVRIFRKHLDRAIFNPDIHYNFDYDTSQDIIFLQQIVQNDQVSTLARQEAQRILLEYELYLLQKNMVKNIEPQITAQREAISSLLKKVSGSLANSIQRDFNFLSDKMKIVTLKGVLPQDYEIVTEYSQIYIKQLREIERELQKLKQKVISTEKKISPEVAFVQVEQKVPLTPIIPPISYATAAAQKVHVAKEFSIKQLQADSGIKHYLATTVLDWFTNTQQALQREILAYPESNKTSEQQMFNVAAHTFPFVVDTFIKQLSYAFKQDDGSILYVIPGSLYIAALNKGQIGYYSWIVKPDGTCVHRSFTIKSFDRDTNFQDQTLYTKKQIEAQLAEIGIAQAAPQISESLSLFSNGLTVTIKDNDTKNIYKLIIKQ